MKAIRNLIQRFFPPAAPLSAGFYRFQSPPDAPLPLRLHLRIEPDGNGLLIINARTVLHLNQTAAEYVYHIIRQTPETEIGEIFADRYNISPLTASQDFQNVREKINTLVQTPDLDPVTFLDIDRKDLYSGSITAPYRLDCAVTYRQSEGTPQDVAPVERVKQELPTADWLTIIEKTARAGIPHIIFTGGEPTLRDDLADLIQFAEQQGLVTGLLTNGLRLANPEYLDRILQSGLDHIMITLDPANDITWKVIQALVAADISLTVHLTLTQQTAPTISETLTALHQMNVKQVSLTAGQKDLQDTLLSAQKIAAQAGLTLVWDIPVPYSAFNPVAVELEGLDELPQGAGKAWLYIEPDGDVLAAQGAPDVLGNILKEDWEQIWANRPR